MRGTMRDVANVVKKLQPTENFTNHRNDLRQGCVLSLRFFPCVLEVAFASESWQSWRGFSGWHAHTLGTEIRRRYPSPS